MRVPSCEFGNDAVLFAQIRYRILGSVFLFHVVGPQVDSRRAADVARSVSRSGQSWSSGQGWLLYTVKNWSRCY